MKRVRLFVLSVFVAGAVAPALLSRTRNGKVISGPGSATVPNSIALSQTAWTPIGPQPIVPLPSNPQLGYPTVSGGVAALAFDPRDTTDKTIYAGSAGGGLWVTTDGGQTWTPLTDSAPSLFVRSIALDPTTSPTTIYVGTGGLDPYGFPQYGAGVLKSTDGGKTWSEDQTFSSIVAKNSLGSWPYIESLAVAPDNNHVVLAAIASFGGTALPGGIWRSNDGGQTWSAVLTESGTGTAGDVPAGTSVVFDPAVPGQAFAALGDAAGQSANGLYESSDDGATWTPIDASSNFGTVNISLTPPTATASGALVAAIANASGYSSNLLGVYAAAIAPGGLVGAFNQLKAAPDFCGGTLNSNPAGECNQYMALAVSPTNLELIYAGGTQKFGGDTLTVSSDGGSTWSSDLYAGNGPCTSKTSSGACINANGQLQTGTQAIAFSPDGRMLAVGGAGGVWSTGNVGASLNVTWNDLNGSLDIARIESGISIYPGNPNMGLAGTASAGTLEYEGNLTWASKLCATGGYSVITPDGSKAYVSCGDNGGVYQLDSSGTATWVANGIGSCASTAAANCYYAGAVAPLALDALHPSNLYFGANEQVYQTSDGGSSWQSVSSVLSTGGTANVSALAVSPADSSEVYAGASLGGVFETNDALDGAHAQWQQVYLPGSFANPASDIVLDPSLSTVAYVSIGAPGAIYETTDSGQSWASISSSLPNVGAVNALAVDPSLWNTIYAATDKGVYETTDGGTAWTLLGTGLPNAPVDGLTLDPKTRVLWAGTEGRGMWALQLAPEPLPPTAIASPASLDFTNVDFGTTSAAKTVTITNTGASTLTISSIDDSDSTIFPETNNCGSSLPVGSSCSLQVKFVSSGGLSGASMDLVINGNMRPGYQLIPLSGSTQDFMITAPAAALSTSQGQPVSTTIDVKPGGSNGFIDPVSLSCSGLPAEAVCAFSPATVTPGTNTASSTLTINTTAPSSVAPLFGPGGPGGWLLAVSIGLLLSLGLLAALARKARKRAGFAIAACALAVCLLAPVASCGGSGTHNPGTPSGQYMVTVKGVSGSLDNATTLTLTVSNAVP